INPDYPTDEAKTLGSIEITDNSSVCKKFIFSYSYFQDNSTSLSGYLATSYGSAITTDKKRLKLNSVREQACNGSEINPAHLFEYFTEQVPRMLSFGQDHWGYANGATNSTLIPTYTINNYTQVSGANRDAAWPAMRGGALKKITYPTGGSTEFEFEPHKTWVSYITYSESSIANKTIGYDGSDPGQVTQAVNLSGGDYKLHVNSSSGGSVAGLVLRNSSNVTVASIGANPGQTVSQSVSNLPAGSYTLILTKTSLATGIGATGSLSQWVPSSTETNATVGGLRIKKITHHDAISSTNNKVINYSYEDATAKSTGILYGKPVYVQVIRNDLIKNVGYWHATNGFQPSCSANGCLTCAGTLDYYKSPSSIRPMASTQGYHIGYNEVKVSETGNGYSIYRYYGSELWQMDIADVAVRSINTVVCDADIPNYPAAPLPHDFKRGKLKYEGYFDESDNILKETTYIPTYVDKAHVTPGLIITSKAITSTSTQHLGTYYELTTAKKTQTEVTAKVYTPGNPSNYLTTVTTTYHGSNYHNMPTRTVTTNSTGKTIESKTTYALDFRIISCDNTSDGLSQLSSDYASCLSTYNSTRLACGSSSTCLTSAYLYYMHCQTQARKSFVTTRRTNFTDASNTFATCKANAKANADATLKPILELQDLFINAPIEATEWKDSKLLSASFNVYNYGPTPSTMVYPDKVQSIDLAAPSATFTVVSNGSTSVSKDSRYQDESDVKFYNGNLVEVKGRDGLYTSYIWGYNNTLPIVKALNVDHATLKNAYDAVSGNLSQVRAQSSLQSALVSTYVYTPLAGMTSETDVKNLAISYEYDGLQRLKLIRDHNNNILKQFAYGYQAYAHNNAVWETTGGLRCKPCQHNASYNTDVQQQEERDVNPESSTYNTYRWTDIGTSSSCVVASWQNTATAVRCKQVNGDITGEQEQEQKDMNPCSPTYNTTRWVVVGTNTTTCPLPIYVKRTYDNYMYLGNSSYCDVILSFYQDAACTIPLSVNNFPVEIEEEVFSSYLGSTSRYYNTYYCTGTSVLVLSGVLRYYDNGLGDYETHDFYIVPNTAYQIGF
ncbi:MAG TPA: hypothetical protein VD996_13530, partial [Chitinophagaceae bacterium]|nr:hypothetical protein [Chitinophagaceae bacterium]